MASGTARARPPRWPRVAIERMNTPGSVAWSCMRTRSPRMAPPLNGEVGSMASTADRLALRPQVADERAGQGRLAGAGRAGQPDRVGLAAQRVGQAADLARRLAAPLDQRQQPGQRRPVTGPGGLEQRAGLTAPAPGHSDRHHFW